MEHIKLLLPFVTFALGMFLAPFIEKRKDEAKARRIHSELMTELEDEISEMPDRLKKMAKCQLALANFKEGNIQIGDPVKYVPRETTLYFLKPAIDASFSVFTRKQRGAVKSLLAQVGALEQYINQIRETSSVSEIDRSINNCKRYLYTGACLLNTMRIVSNKGRAKNSQEDKHVIEGIFLDYDINLTFDDILIKSVVVIDHLENSEVDAKPLN